MKLSAIVLILVEVLCLGAIGSVSLAQAQHGQGPSAQQARGTEESARVAELLEQLGADSFLDRESASAELFGLGESALEGLRTISPTAAFEIRHRAKLIRERIENDKFTALSRSFLLDLDNANSYGLPAWHKYREVVGASRTGKLLFLEMIREQPELARLIDVASDVAPSPAAYVALEALAAVEAVRLREQLFALREPRIGDAVAMLLVAATVPRQTPVEVSEIIVSNERRAFGGRITEPGYRDCLRKLLSAWLPRTHQSMAPTAMDCALRYDLNAGLEIARLHLTPNFDSDTRKLAFYCLAKFGNETDVQLLLPLLDDQKIVDEFARSAIDGDIHVSNAAPPGIEREVAPGGNMVVRVHDLAIVTAMLLMAEDPSQLYPRFEPNPQTGFFIHSLASPPDSVEAQQQRIDQWKLQHQPRQIES